MRGVKVLITGNNFYIRNAGGYLIIWSKMFYSNPNTIFVNNFTNSKGKNIFNKLKMSIALNGPFAYSFAYTGPPALINEKQVLCIAVTS